MEEGKKPEEILAKDEILVGVEIERHGVGMSCFGVEKVLEAGGVKRDLIEVHHQMIIGEGAFHHHAAIAIATSSICCSVSLL